MMIGTKEETIQAYTEIGCLLKYFPNSFIEKLPNKLLEIINTSPVKDLILVVLSPSDITSPVKSLISTIAPTE